MVSYQSSTSKHPLKKRKRNGLRGTWYKRQVMLKMYEERSGIKVEQIVTLITCQTGDTQVFIKNPDDYVPLLRDYIQEYNDAQ